jgi:hypothetical protein
VAYNIEVERISSHELRSLVEQISSYVGSSDYDIVIVDYKLKDIVKINEIFGFYRDKIFIIIKFIYILVE